MFGRTVANSVLDLRFAVFNAGGIDLTLLADVITANTLIFVALILVAYTKHLELMGRRIVKGVPLELQCPH